MNYSYRACKPQVHEPRSQHIISTTTRITERNPLSETKGSRKGDLWRLGDSFNLVAWPFDAAGHLGLTNPAAEVIPGKLETYGQVEK